MMTYSLRNKTVALAMAVVFALSLIMMPVSTAFAADKVDFGGSYIYVEPGDDVQAGSVTVTYGDSSAVSNVYFKITLPSGVEFASPPPVGNVYSSGNTGQIEPTNVNVEVLSSSSTLLNVYAETTGLNAWDNNNDEVKFNFTHLTLDIDDDFSGDLKVNVEVLGIDSSGGIVWSENGTITIAKVGKKEVSVTADDPKTLSAGQDRKAAEITIKESLPGTLAASSTLDTAYKIDFKILTDGVEFNSNTSADGDYIGISTIELTDNDTVARIYIDAATTTFAGEIELTPRLNIDPDVSGDIKIKVSAGDANEDVLDTTTLTVATVGELRAKIDGVEDNDGVIYAGKDKELDTSFKVVTVGGTNFKVGDMITFELSAGKFADDPSATNTSNVVRYNDDKAFYVIANGSDDEIKIKDIKISLKPDVEPGDLKIKVGGDYGNIGEVVIAKIEKPFTAEAKEATKIVRDASAQPVANIIIKEADEETITGTVYLVLPEGMTFTKTPEVEVTEGDLELEDPVLIKNDEVLKIEVDSNSSEKSTIEISDIKYDVKSWANFGDVEIEIANNPDGDDPFTTVVNAKVVDANTVAIEFNAKTDDAVVIKNGRVLLRVNALCNIMGLEKSWDAVNKIAYFVKDGKVVEFPVGKNEVVIQGVRVPVDQGAEIINDFTYVPIRYIKTGFGGELDWDNATKTATYTFTK